ncbi:16S rRNA pseudouridine(516) synthase RsuA [Neptunomonas antarctica]|nr:16S rRNA pseudouridine(516) synthase RsuA [Neptunomonas antarctica]
MRLDKYLSQSTGLSRKDIKRLIHKDLATVNGMVTRDSSLQVSEDDNVTFQEMVVDAPRPRYFMMNKPYGYVCSSEDPTNATVMGLLIDEPRPTDLHLAGRLDLDTTGLLLITDDGQWSHRLTSPKHKQGKRYLVETADPIEASTVELFAQGVQLINEKQLTKPATLEILGSHQAYLTLMEGRYHQVKRMFASVGNKVTKLHRDRISHIDLDESLAPGEYRELTHEEINISAQ